jgi:GNAT superfamily N-acetyltransferase
VTAKILVRPAREDDKDAVLAFCRDTFSWGDYIPNVWDIWLTETRGQLLVGEVDHHQVGLLHLAFLGNDVAWMEGMRVRPDFRRQGIGSTVDAAARWLARERGCRIARLATSTKNIAAQKTLESEGYICVARFNEWKTKPTRSKVPAVRVAAQRDAAELSKMWETSPERAISALLPDRYWHWYQLTHARLIGHVDAGEIRIVDGGLAFLDAIDESDWSGMSLHALAGNEESVFTLALAARGEAHYRGYPRIEAILIDHLPLNLALERAGYHRQGGMLIYEQVL